MAMTQSSKAAKGKEKDNERVCVNVQDAKITHLSPKIGDSVVVRGEVLGFSVGDRY